MAPGRRASKAAQKTPSEKNGQAQNSIQNETPRALSREDVTCKICLEVLFKPVTLPCKHNMCYSCFENCVEKSNLTCPLCRKRISIWSRQAKKTNTVVDEKLWAEIQSQYPDLVKAFMEGKTTDNNPEDVLPTIPTHQFAEPGDLRKEYEAEQERIRVAEEERRRQEELASAALIAQLEKEQAEELSHQIAEMERQRLKDEALAMQLAKEDKVLDAIPENSTVIATPQSSRKRKTSTELSKSTPAAKKINSFFSSRLHSIDSDELSSSPSAFVAVTEHLPKGMLSCWEQRDLSPVLDDGEGSDDSKRLHFRPINAAPLTPPKNSPGSSTLVKPQVVGATARNLIRLYQTDDDIGDLNHNHALDEPSSSSGLAEELKELEREWLKKKQELEEADRMYALQLQKELDEQGVVRSPVNRAKGSKDEYQLRRTSRNSKQQKIEDSFQRPTRKSAP